MPADKSLSSEALHKFLMIHRHLRQMARNTNKQGIRGRHIAVLQYLQEQGTVTVSDIQDYIYTSASTASTLIKQLEDAGHVIRTRSEEDNRVVIIELTESGRELAQTTEIAGIGLLRRRLPDLSDEQLAVINQALGDIMEMMEVTETE